MFTEKQVSGKLFLVAILLSTIWGVIAGIAAYNATYNVWGMPQGYTCYWTMNAYTREVTCLPLGITPSRLPTIMPLDLDCNKTGSVYCCYPKEEKVTRK